MTSNTYALCLAALIACFTLWLRPMGLIRKVPVVLHNVSWALSLFVVGSGVVHYTPDTWLAWTLITAGIVAFNVAMLLPSLVSPERSTSSAADRPLLSPSIFWLIFVGYTVGFLFFLRSETQLLGLTGILHNASSIRAYQSSVGFQNSFSLPFKLLFYLGPLLFVIVLNGWLVAPALKKTTRFAVFLFTVLSLVATLGRTYLFIAILWEVGFLILRVRPRRESTGDVTTSTAKSVHSWRRRSQTLGYLGIVTVSLATFQILASAEGKTSATSPSVQSNVSPIIQGSPWTSLLIYDSSAIPGFSQLTASTDHRSPPRVAPLGQYISGNYNPQTWGRDTFQAFLKVIPLFPSWEQVGPFTSVPVPTNVYTWFEPYYRDFREPGVVILTFLSGLILIWLVRRRHRGPEWLLAASLMVGLTAFAPYANKLADVLTVEMIFLVAILGRRYRRQGLPAGELPSSKRSAMRSSIPAIHRGSASPVGAFTPSQAGAPKSKP